MILILDNYDSFVHNIARYLRELGATVEVVRSDSLTVEAVAARGAEGLVLSPGPCRPAEAGISLPVIRALAPRVPILGICLGHQAVGEAFGAEIVRSAHPVHGRSSPIHHRGGGILAGLPSPFEGARYHSLEVSRHGIPGDLEVVAWSRGEVMALRHRRYSTWGIQFHPESILTEGGHHLLSNFLRLCGRLPSRISA